jgi:hypothetical protein
VPVPNDMDGKVLRNMFEDDLIAKHVAVDEEPDVLPFAAADSSYTDEDTVVIADRLRALGYIE